jgi:hypothetical protein
MVVSVKQERDDDDDDVTAKFIEEDAFSNLSRLAEVSLAAEGKLDDVALSRRIHEARQRALFAAASAASAAANGLHVAMPNGILICADGEVKARPKTAVLAMQQQQQQQQYSCHICGKEYSTSSNLARHRQTHRQEHHVLCH